MKPKFSLFKNIGYAIAGFKNVLKEEAAFKIQVFTFVLLSIVLLLINFSLLAKLILFTSMLFVLLGEAINTAMERIVDLVSPEYHDLAKNAKDIGALIVLLFFTINCFIWLTTLLWEFGLI